MIFSRNNPKLPEQVAECMDKFKKNVFDIIPGNFYVAGGALRDWFDGGKTANDIDLFFSGQADFDNAINTLKGLGGKVIFETPNAIKVSYKGKSYDLVRARWYNQAEDIVNSFDFTVCAIALTKEPLSLTCHDDFFIDLTTRRLKINSIPFPIDTLRRLQKYIKKGFTICNNGIKTIAGAIKADNRIQPLETDSQTFYRVD